LPEGSTTLELLAPARNTEIGIAAIDCGADAVYMAGPAFGAREAAGNTVEDVASLCDYAHKFGVRIFVTVNTILYDDELEEAGRMLQRLQEAGADAFIVQDLALLEVARKNGITVPLHASTQCSIRTPERARLLEDMGFSRLVLERELSLRQVREIGEATEAEIEFFVHGAICVCYNGQCHLSEHLAGRSSNRGACIQACRSRYNLVEEGGRTLAKDKPLLSLKDYNLLDRLEDLAEAGVNSFKIEGRLKSISYVRNTVRQYSLALDSLVAKGGGRWRRASFGRVEKGFQPDLSKTFNRGYTSLYIDGTRGRWASLDAPKSLGEHIGRVESVRKGVVEVRLADRTIRLANGDGFAFPSKGEVVGFRGDVCERNTIKTSGDISKLQEGTELYRNMSAEFEKSLTTNPCQRSIPAKVKLSFEGTTASGYSLRAVATSEDGRTVAAQADCGFVAADNPDRTKSLAVGQLSKTAGVYEFSASLEEDGEQSLPLVRAAELNALRRALAAELDKQPCRRIPLRNSGLGGKKGISVKGMVSYKADVSNHLSRQAYLSRGAEKVEDAYELSHREDAELMRTKYCIRYELGLCPVHQGAKPTGTLFLRNNGRLLRLGFDCASCEMTVSAQKADRDILSSTI